MELIFTQKTKNALFVIGAFFFGLASLSCQEKDKRTASWASDSSGQEIALEVSEESGKGAKPPSSGKKATNREERAQVRFLSYNLKNYLTMRRGKTSRGKPENQVESLVALIVEQKPDILGVCETGTLEDLFDLRERLKDKGIDLPHHEYTGGADRTRHLGLLSRYPIIARDSQSGLHYELEGQTRSISRGILDATIDTGSHQIRFLGVHLKSKREIEDADQELIRQHEAHLVRSHANSILDEDLKTPLLLYGDFNDTIGSKTLSILKGRNNSKKALVDFPFKDSRQELWTHFWDYQDTYTRFDYTLFSKAARPLLIGKESYIVDDPRWAEASDHRALLLVIQ